MLTHKGTQTIDTERLILRKFELSDSENVHKNWAGDALVQEAYHEPVYANTSEVSEILQKIITPMKLRIIIDGR